VSTQRGDIKATEDELVDTAAEPLTVEEVITRFSAFVVEP
jgi:hypothetical protein